MTYWLNDDKKLALQDPFAAPAPAPFSTGSQRFRASAEAEDIAADRGSMFIEGSGLREERQNGILRDLADRLAAPLDLTPAQQRAMDSLTPDQQRAPPIPTHGATCHWTASR